MGRRPLYLLILTFFGLTYNDIPIVRINLFKQIHEIIFHGKGGYDYQTIYNMPIWLRKYTFKEIHDFYENEHNAHTGNSQSKTLVDSSGKVNTPEFLKASKEYTSKPTYSTRASKK
jgi:hypothetical protein